MNLPIEFEKRMSDMLGEGYNEFRSSLNDPVPYTGIRVNTDKENAVNAVKTLRGIVGGVEWCSDGFYADKSLLSGNHPYHLSGPFYFQEPSAMSTVEALPIKAGDYILDLCAAPGGKATQAAIKLHGTGLVVANEIVGSRAKILSENIERMGLKNTIVTSESPDNLEKKFEKYFDCIIVDAPCSGEGMFRKEPQAIEHWSIEHTYSCANRQKNIIDSAVKMLRDGGYLVYSTCTFAQCENELIAQYILDTYSNMELCDIESLRCLSNGISSNKNHDLTKTRRVFPNKNKGEGHFVALFKNTNSMTERKVKNKENKLKSNLKEMVEMYEDFAKKTFKTFPIGEYVAFGDTLYAMPQAVDIDKIKVIRPGLELGICKKGRFEPSHALCLAMKTDEFLSVENFVSDNLELHNYLVGNTVQSEKKGWTAVCVDGYPLGWIKSSNGVGKNHYPKHLRLHK